MAVPRIEAFDFEKGSEKIGQAIGGGIRDIGSTIGNAIKEANSPENKARELELEMMKRKYNTEEKMNKFVTEKIIEIKINEHISNEKTEEDIVFSEDKLGGGSVRSATEEPPRFRGLKDDVKDNYKGLKEKMVMKYEPLIKSMTMNQKHNFLARLAQTQLLRKEQNDLETKEQRKSKIASNVDNLERMMLSEEDTETVMKKNFSDGNRTYYLNKGRNIATKIMEEAKAEGREASQEEIRARLIEQLPEDINTEDINAILPVGSSAAQSKRDIEYSKDKEAEIIDRKKIIKENNKTKLSKDKEIEQTRLTTQIDNNINNFEKLSAIADENGNIERKAKLENDIESYSLKKEALLYGNIFEDNPTYKISDANKLSQAYSNLRTDKDYYKFIKDHAGILYIMESNGANMYFINDLKERFEIQSATESQNEEGTIIRLEDGTQAHLKATMQQYEPGINDTEGEKNITLTIPKNISDSQARKLIKKAKNIGNQITETTKFTDEDIGTTKLMIKIDGINKTLLEKDYIRFLDNIKLKEKQKNIPSDSTATGVDNTPTDSSYIDITKTPYIDITNMDGSSIKALKNDVDNNGKQLVLKTTDSTGAVIYKKARNKKGIIKPLVINP